MGASGVAAPGAAGVAEPGGVTGAGGVFLQDTMAMVATRGRDRRYVFDFINEERYLLGESGKRDYNTQENFHV
jgi:hypothetical protein